MPNGRQQRLHEVATDLQEIAISGEVLFINLSPIELGCEESRLSAGIRNLCDTLGIREFRKARKLLAPPFPHGVGEFPLVVAEKEEWLLRAPFLAHEQHGYLRSEQVDAGERPDRLGRCQHVEPFAKRAIADLVVILDEGYESVRRQSCAGTAAGRVAIRHHLPLIGEAFGDGFAQELR